jgi:acetyl esterase/lipase
MGYDLLDPTQFSEFIYPESSSLAPIAQSPPSYFGPDSATPGTPSNPRTLLSRLWLQFGTYLDYWTGLHEPSISAKLRKLLPAEGEDIAVVDACLAAALPASEHAIFPQLLVNSEWPPVLLIHGSEDSAVLAPSSRVFHTRLLNAKVQSALRIVEGSEHSFDLRRGAEEKFGALFDEAAEFLRAALLDA